MAQSVGLTDAKIAGLKPPVSGQIEYADKVVPGLRVRVGSSGVKTYILRKRAAGKLVNIRLGHHGPRYGLMDARRAARDTLVALHEGEAIPKPLKAEALRGESEDQFASAFRVFDKQHLSTLRSAEEVRRIVERHLLPIFGTRTLKTISRKDVIKLVDDVVYQQPDKPTPNQGKAVLAQLSSFMSWCAARDLIDVNPCIGIRKPAIRGPRDRVLTDTELRNLWAICSDEAFPFGYAVQLLILTGARRSEVFEARWNEIDVDAAVWSIPAARAKNGVAQRLPLSGAALAVLVHIGRDEGSELVFPARGNPTQPASGFSKVQARLTAKLAAVTKPTPAHWTFHDLRRTVATGMQRLGVRLEVIEAVLNHVSGTRGGIVGVYQRHQYEPEKRAALDRWAAHVDELVKM